MALSREEILSYMATQDTSVLEKLYKYSTLLIIPEEDLLIDVNMAQMVDKAHEYANALFPTWTDRSKSDFGEFLVELFAVFSEKDFWYVNAFANDSLYSKARLYSNVYVGAIEKGYQPVDVNAASAQFKIIFPSGEQKTILKGSITVTTDEGVAFTNLTDITLEASSVNKELTVTLYEGKILTDSVAFDGRNILIRKPSIHKVGIDVVINEVTWTQVKNFGLSKDYNNHYLVLPEQDGSCSIYFGSKGFGVTPAIGEVVNITYLKCSGSKGNAAQQNVTINKVLDTRGAISAEMLQDATGGTDQESITSIKNKAPLFYFSKRSGNNPTTCQKLLNALPEVFKSKVIIVGNTLAYYCIPTSGAAELTVAEAQSVADNFEQYVISGYTITKQNNNYVDILAEATASGITLEVQLASGYDVASTTAQLKTYLQDYTNPMVHANYGSGFSKFSADLLLRNSIKGIQSITYKKTGTEDIFPELAFDEYQIMQKLDLASIAVKIEVV